MKHLTILCFCLLIFQSCTFSVDEKDLVGTWDYIRIDNLNPSSEDSTTVAEIKAANPFISFSEKGELKIIWAGKVLSSGTYTIEGKIIRYKEDLADGRIREFPFLVSKLSENEIVFETMTREGSRVNAIKRK